VNSISDKIRIGTVGELLVTLRLLQHGVQASPPLKDSGNDLVAVRGCEFRAIQVKTTQSRLFRLTGLPELYHIVALVHLVGQDQHLSLDESKIFLLAKDQITRTTYAIEKLGEYELTQDLIESLFLPCACSIPSVPTQFQFTACSAKEEAITDESR